MVVLESPMERASQARRLIGRGITIHLAAGLARRVGPSEPKRSYKFPHLSCASLLRWILLHVPDRSVHVLFGVDVHFPIIASPARWHRPVRLNVLPERMKPGSPKRHRCLRFQVPRDLPDRAAVRSEDEVGVVGKDRTR